MKETKAMVRDTVIMTAVSMIMQTAAVGFNLYLNRQIGTAGMGVFQLIMTVYGMSVTFSSAGTRLAATRLTAEQTALGRRGADALPLCAVYALVNSFIISAALYILSDFIAYRWIDDPGAAGALKILSFSLPFVAESCVLSGYFTAEGYASPYYGIRLTEQLCKIGATVLLLDGIIGKITPVSAIVTGITLSEAISLTLACGLFIFVIRRTKLLPKAEVTLRYLLRIALPDLAGAGARSVLLTVEHLLIPKAFERSGASKETSLAAYGTVHAVTLPVLLWPGALLQSVAALVIPKAARENAIGNTEGIRELCRRLMHLTAVFAVGCSVIILFYSKPLGETLHTDNASHYLFVLAPLIPVMYCDMTTDALLRGLDKQLYSMIYNILDSALCVILVAVILPKYAIRGYIFILYISEIINFILSISRLLKTVSFPFSFYRSVLKPGVCAAVSCLPFVPYLTRMGGAKVWTGFGIAATAVIYISILLFTSGRKSDLQIEKLRKKTAAEI